MRVLVTGAGGRIGRATTDELITAGHEVVALAREADSAGVGDLARVIVGDCTDTATVRQAVAGVDAVVHLAAIPSPHGADPEVVFANNTLATFVVLDAAGERGVRRAVIASSISALGLAWAAQTRSPVYVPIDEEHPPQIGEPYALSKLVDEQTAAMMHRRHGMQVLAYRFPFTTDAAGIDRRAGEVCRDPGVDAKVLWAYLDIRDAAGAVRLGVESEVGGCHVLNVVAPDTLSDENTAELVARYHPSAEVRAPLHGRATPYTTERAERLLGFRARHGWRRQEGPLLRSPVRFDCEPNDTTRSM